MITLTPPSSRIRRTLFVLGFVCLATTFAGIVFVAASKHDSRFASSLSAKPVGQTSTDSQANAEIAKRFGKLPLSFEINQGQTDRSVKFLSHGPGYDLFLTAADAVL